ncbi:MAG TPA: gliding motility-associated C-terminal domain-containing protein, partial [Saprospiraceae bacterium]|nr:gliding motility-associated C-terminal domain-containing protein [Saprospiraceae bacterium]
NDATICAPNNIILAGTAGGSNVTYSWQENGTGSITNPNTLNTNYTPTLADITNGSVSFTLRAIDQTGFCPSAQETITVDIDGSAYFILDPATQTYCDTADLIVDFDDLITFGSLSGQWFFPDTVSASITGGSQFNPNTLQAGNYTVFYTLPNAGPPCLSDTLGINLIIENCLCPSVALSVPVDALCSGSGTQNLNDFLITTETGSWSIVGKPAGTKPAVISGTNFITNNSDFGIYDLRFTLSSPVAGCDPFAEISLEVIETPTVQISSSDCADGLQSWEAVIITSAEDVTNTVGNLTSLGSNRYSITNIPLNTTLQVTASNGNGLCSVNIDVTAPDCECTLSISGLPDNLSLCPGEASTLSPNVTGGKGAVTEYWIVANDTLHQSSLSVTQSGLYHFVSTDELGCKEEHFIDVLIYEEMVPDITATDITCPGDKDGVILLHGIQGGNGPYSISFNGGSSTPVNSFPYMIGNLGVGNYQIELTDKFNCAIEFNVMVHSTSSETLDLGPDQTILVGDSVFIAPSLSFQPDTFYWTGDVDFIITNHLDNWTSPEDDISLELFAIDDKGCLYSDDITIKVLLTSSIYVPTIFSPNGDGVNDLLGPVSDPSITSFEYFQIYSRWGELLYSQTNFIPNRGNFGWDGTLKDKPLMPGVFVYRLKAVNKRGNVYTQYGDITLVR